MVLNKRRQSSKAKLEAANNTLTIDVANSTIWRLIGFALAIIVVVKLQTLILYLLFSALFAVALHPLVARIEKLGIKRGFGLGLILIFIVGGLVTLIGLSFASLADTFIDFAKIAPDYLDQIDSGGRFDAVIVEFQKIISDLDISTIASNAVEGGGSLLSGVSKVVEAFVFIFFFTVYMLLESHYLMRIGRALVPDKWRDESRDIVAEGTKVIGGYIRGQFLTSALMGVVSYIIFKALGMPNALALAIIMALTDVIPLIGGTLGMIPAVLIALTISPVRAILVIVLVQGYGIVNGNIISPKVYGQSLDLSPFLIALSTTVGLFLFGAAGILLALPVAALASYILTKYKGIPIVDRTD